MGGSSSKDKVLQDLDNMKTGLTQIYKNEEKKKNIILLQEIIIGYQMIDKIYLYRILITSIIIYIIPYSINITNQ